MESEFDPAKNLANIAKHGVPLSFGENIFGDPAHVIVGSSRPEDHEHRLKVVGQVGAKLFTGVFVWRGGKPRFISVRRSNASEQRPYLDPG